MSEWDETGSLSFRLAEFVSACAQPCHPNFLLLGIALTVAHPEYAQALLASVGRYLDGPHPDDLVRAVPIQVITEAADINLHPLARERARG